MAGRVRLAALAEVSLRVPPLFVVDELLKMNLGIPAAVEAEDSMSAPIAANATTAASVAAFLYDSDAFRALFYVLAKTAIHALGQCSAPEPNSTVPPFPRSSSCRLA